jgi:hypothetical protein
VIKILQMNDDFQPLGPAIPKPAPAAPKSVEIKPGIWQAPDGKLRTDFATGQSVAPAQKAAPVAPLPPLPNAMPDADGWVVWGGGAVPDFNGGCFVRFQDGEETSYRNSWTDKAWGQAYEGRDGDCNIVAYKLIP